MDNRMAPNWASRIMGSGVGSLLARSWLDPMVLSGLQQVFFPLSRLWAAARTAHGDSERFWTAAAIKTHTPAQQQRVQVALTEFERRRQRMNSAEAAWREAFWGTDSARATAHDAAAERRLAVEKERLSVRTHYNASRSHFWFLRKQLQCSVQENFVSPQDLRAHLQAATATRSEDGADAMPDALARHFMPPSTWPQVETSAAIPGVGGESFWIRFPSPSPWMRDTVYARVYQPVAAVNPPTLIYGHGICVDFDHWDNLVDPINWLPQMGIRVIRPEGPWHGRRVPDGYFGGEYFLSSAPQGAFDYFSAQHQEWASLIHWARATSSAPLAVGGCSLGALSAQMLAIRARDWPRELQPDVLFLVTHSQHLEEVTLDGALSDIWGLHEKLHALGWTRQNMQQYFASFAATGKPVMPGSRIISVLGAEDNVTPFASGKRQQEEWQLPAANRFIWPCGHFTVPMRLIRDQQPFRRLLELLLQPKIS